MRRVQTVFAGPANRVTLVRAVLTAAVAVLVLWSLVGAVSVPALVVLATLAQLLDAVDGRIARLTDTVTEFGARFDLEVDACLILALSGYVAHLTGWWWVLAIGTMRYAFVAARWRLPRLRGTLPPRRWCKVVAATQGLVLTVAAADLLPRSLTAALLVVALLLLVESFGREVWELWHLPAVPVRPPMRPVVVTVLAGAAVWAALVLPNDADRLGPAAFLRLPVELLVLLALAVLLTPRAGVAAAALFGAALAVLVVLKVLDMGFRAVLDRPFDPVADWSYLGPAVGVLGDSVGPPAARATAVAAAVAVVALLVLLPLCVIRLARAVSRRRGPSLRALGALGLVWALCAASGFAPVAHLATADAAGLALDEVDQVRADLADRRTFAREISADGYAGVPADRLLAGLRGKDVLLVFVESYGRVAVEGSTFSPGVDAVLDAGTARLRAAGYSTRSAFLTSPTFGAASWLAHSTLQSGLWVDSQQRYDQLLGSDRLTLTRAFGRAGWRTVFDVPANTRDWPEGAEFYGVDQLYDSRNVGYAGPEFGYASMPDQYTLAALRRLELPRRDRAPVMAEIDLVSSHHPWTPLPRPVDWTEVGDGSVFAGMPERGESSAEVFGDPDAVRRVYGESIEYSLDSLVSFLVHYPDPDRVVVLLGDHQPHSYVTGAGAGHDVPITLVAQDPDVLRRTFGWGWPAGMNPGPDAPVWPMDAFRDRFLAAFG